MPQAAIIWAGQVTVVLYWDDFTGLVGPHGTAAERQRARFSTAAPPPGGEGLALSWGAAEDFEPSVGGEWSWGAAAIGAAARYAEALVGLRGGRGRERGPVPVRGGGGLAHAKALTARAVIEQAKHGLMGSRPCTADEVFLLLTRASQHQDRHLRDVAVEVIGSAPEPRLSAPGQAAEAAPAPVDRPWRAWRLVMG